MTDEAKPNSAITNSLVLVEWVDASRLNNGWMDLSDVPNPYPHRCVTVGFLASRNDNGVILIPTIADIEHEDNIHTYGGMMIPTASIVSERVLSGFDPRYQDYCPARSNPGYSSDLRPQTPDREGY